MLPKNPVSDFEADIPMGLVGCDYRRGSTRWRSQLVLTHEERERMSKELLGTGIVEGLALLDTCNRNEWIFSTPNPCWAGEILKAQMIKRWQGMQGTAPVPYVYVGDDALRHILRVAAGLESFVVGERQILTQFNKCLESARHDGISSVYLNKLGSITSRVVREVREKAEPRGFMRGIHDVACRYLEIHGFKPATVLVVGTGEIGRRVAASLESKGGTKVLRMNRTVPPGRCAILPLSDLPRVRADVVLACTAAPKPILTPGNLPRGATLLMDLGIPSQVDRDIGDLPDVTRVDLDDLLADDQFATYLPDQLAAANRIIDDGQREYARFCLQHRFVNVLDSTRRQNEEFISHVLPDFVTELLPEAEPGVRARMEARLRILIRNYTASIFQSINESITGKG